MASSAPSAVSVLTSRPSASSRTSSTRSKTSPQSSNTAAELTITRKCKRKFVFLLHFSRFFISLPIKIGEVTPSRQKRKQVSLFCARLSVTLQAITSEISGITMRILTIMTAILLAMPMGAQGKKEFTVVKQLPITSVKNQYRSGTCWDYGTLGYLESEILRKTGKTYDLCEMFVVNKDYMDNATHYVRMHGYSQISEGGSCDDVVEVIRQHGICPEEAMPAPGSLQGDTLANFTVFFPELERMVSSIVKANADLNRITESEQKQALAKQPRPHWRDSVHHREIRGPLSRDVRLRRENLYAQVVCRESGAQPRRLCKPD